MQEEGCTNKSLFPSGGKDVLQSSEYPEGLLLLPSCWR